MKVLFCLLLAAICGAPPAFAKDLGAHPVFRHFVGAWKATGELKGEQGNVVTITEDWTGKADGDNAFLIEGTRTLNGDTQPFKWSISYNEGADSYEAVLTGGDASQALRFEGHASEVTLTLDLKAVTGSGASAIAVTDTFVGENKDIIESQVTFTGDAGQITLSGTIKHEKQKTP